MAVTFSHPFNRGDSIVVEDKYSPGVPFRTVVTALDSFRPCPLAGVTYDDFEMTRGRSTYLILRGTLQPVAVYGSVHVPGVANVVTMSIGFAKPARSDDPPPTEPSPQAVLRSARGWLVCCSCNQEAQSEWAEPGADGRYTCPGCKMWLERAQ